VFFYKKVSILITIYVAHKNMTI